jgi:hypothetical protein
MCVDETPSMSILEIVCAFPQPSRICLMLNAADHCDRECSSLNEGVRLPHERFFPRNLAWLSWAR